MKYRTIITTASFVFAAAAFLGVGVVLRLMPFLAIGVLLLVLAGMAASRIVKPYRPHA